MILDILEAEARLSSVDNLVNRLEASRLNSRSARAEISNLYGIREESSRIPAGGSGGNPCLPPSVDELITNIGDKLNLGLAHDGAIEVLKDSINLLKNNLINCDPSHPERLSKIATEMSRVVHTIDEVRNGNKLGNNAPTIIYRPVMMAENHYETINVHE